MFQTQVKMGTEYVWSDIQFVNGRWYAWYHEDFRIENNRNQVADPNAVQ